MGLERLQDTAEPVEIMSNLERTLKELNHYLEKLTPNQKKEVMNAVSNLKVYIFLSLLESHESEVFQYFEL